MFPNISLNRRMPNGTSGGVRGASNPSPYSICFALKSEQTFFNQGGLDTLFNHVGEQIAHAVAVTPLVVVPANQLEERIVQADTGAGIED